MLRLLSFIMLITVSMPLYLATTETPHRIATAEKIAGYSWYHWPRPEADSCVVWLGGGQFTTTYVTVNPYRLESLNTMRFIQDLSGRYGMLALSEGEISYRVDSRLISKICKWVRSSGYAYAFVVGYSTGGVALAYELTIPEENDPGPDAAIIITSMLDWKEMIEKHRTSSGIALYMSARNSRNVRRSTLLMYGELAWFWPQGEEYYKNLPEEGWYGTHWFHKGWQLLKGVEHEVFTLEKDGSYDSKPLAIATEFLERIRTSNLKKIENLIPRAQNGESINGSSKGREQIDVYYPARVSQYEIFQINASILPIINTERQQVAIFDLEQKTFLALRDVVLGRERNCSLPVVFVTNQSSRSLMAIALVLRQDGSEILGISREMEIEVSDKIRVVVEAGAAAQSIKIDDQTYKTDDSGSLRLSLEKGNHSFEIPSEVPLSEKERLHLVSWANGEKNNRTNLSLDQDISLKPRYVSQYLLTVKSEYGKIHGDGWYDANSTAAITVNFESANSLNEEEALFAGWSDDPSGRSLYHRVIMNTPKTITAKWEARKYSSEPVWLLTVVSIITSIVTVLVYVANLKKRKKQNMVAASS